MKPFEVTMPIKTPNPVNGSHRHWKTAAGIRSKQKTTALRLIPRLDLEPVVEVRLTRVSAGRLDDDNLGPALKAVRDAVAYRLRLDDASGLVRWVYGQEEAPRGEQAVRVSVRWLVQPLIPWANARVPGTEMRSYDMRDPATVPEAPERGGKP